MTEVKIPYCGAAPIPAELLSRWNFDPVLIAALALGGISCWRLAASPESRRATVAAFALLTALYVSPFCALSSALFSVRVFHHVTLAALVAPLLAQALPLPRRFGSLSMWTIVQTLVFWFWHAPAPYAAALSSDAIYWIMQLSLLGTATGFWMALGHSRQTGAVAGLVATMVQMGLLGALLTFSASPLYVPHFGTTQAWGLLPLEDQQLAGLIMWVPGSAVYLIAALRYVHRWIAPPGSTAAAV